MNATWQSDDGSVRLFLGSALDVLPHVRADCVVTDPPYGMAHKSGHWPGDFAIEGDLDTCVRDAALALVPDGTPMAVFGNWRCAKPKGTRNCLVWDKTDGTGPGMGDLRQLWGHSHEEIYIIGNWFKGEKKRLGSVIRTTDGIRSLAVKVGHPTPKPLSIVSALVDASPPGCCVLDMFMGSGPTIEAAIRLGRKAVGVELSPEYFWDICVPRAKRALAERAAQLPFVEGK